MIISKRKILAVCIIFIISIGSLPIVNSKEMLQDGCYNIEYSGIDQELNLLRGEFYLYIDAVDNVTSFNVIHAFPPEYGYQYPIYLEILEDTTAKILNYKIDNQDNIPNKVINFTVGEINTGEQILIHFNTWVLVESYNYEDLPGYKEIPSIADLPSETKPWLSQTEVAQKDHFLIKSRAQILRFSSKNNMLILAEKIAKFCAHHRYLSWALRYKLSGLLGYPPQDALTALLAPTECSSRSHLGCALFRANNVPARVVLAMPANYKFWFEMHYMAEYYLKDFGWVLTDVHGGKTPYAPQEIIILRLCYPDDENNTQTDYMFSRMKGEERWMWFDNENVKPYYVDLEEGSKMRSFSENKVVVDLNVANDTIDLTSYVFNKYQAYLGVGLIDENLQHFQNATDYMMQAIQELDSNDDSFGYIYYLNKAKIEFDLVIT